MTAITQTYQGSITKKDVQSYTVPKGTITINQWWVGTQYIKKSNLKVVLYWDKNGNGVESEWKKIAVAYNAKATYRRILNLNNTFTSKGNSKIWVRQWVAGTNGAPNKPRQTFVRWQGDFTPAHH
jgi:hypothetical protein